jgi:hypothetical protein
MDRKERSGGNGVRGWTSLVRRPFALWASEGFQLQQDVNRASPASAVAEGPSRAIGNGRLRLFDVVAAPVSQLTAAKGPPAIVIAEARHASSAGTSCLHGLGYSFSYLRL